MLALPPIAGLGHEAAAYRTGAERRFLVDRRHSSDAYSMDIAPNFRPVPALAWWRIP